jgi:Flp pilus assembly protein TadD
VYGEHGRYADAIVQFKAAEVIAPGDPEYGTNLATALAASGSYDEARQALRAVLTVTLNYEPARALWGQLGSH